MLDVNALKAQDLQGLSQSAMVELATEMLARIAAMNTLLQARDKQFGLETMCVGGGMGMAMVLERLS